MYGVASVFCMEIFGVYKVYARGTIGVSIQNLCYTTPYVLYCLLNTPEAHIKIRIVPTLHTRV